MQKGEIMNRNKAFCSTLALLAVVALTAVIPEQAAAQIEKGIELYNSGEYQEAEVVLGQAVITAHYYLGLSLLEQEKNGEALDIFLIVKRSLDRTEQGARPPVPSKSQVQLATGRAYLALEQYEEAVKELEKAISLDENNAYAYYYAGLAYYALGNGKRAAEDLDTFIKMAPNAPEVEHAKEVRNVC
jgi:tetratricopeptide (TPR) repeat protein